MIETSLVTCLRIRCINDWTSLGRSEAWVGAHLVSFVLDDFGARDGFDKQRRVPRLVLERFPHLFLGQDEFDPGWVHGSGSSE